MTKQLDEFALNLPVNTTTDTVPAIAGTSQDAAVVVPSNDEVDTSMAIGNPSTDVDCSMVSVFVNNITPCNYGGANDAVASFDVAFTVGINCEDGSCKTYQVIKRIGIDKSKIASDAMNSLPVSVVEAKKPADTKPQINESAKRARQLAGLE